MKALVLQHHVFEEAYEVGVALAARGVELDVRLMGRDRLPVDIGEINALVVMGGPMAAYDGTGFPTRRSELDLLGQAIDRQVPTLGICLGAQLLAVAAGGAAVPGTAGTEIGWAPVRLAPTNDVLFAGLAPELTVLHWHGDTVVLPPGAELLASTDRYPNQAFRVGPAAWGLQFHVEVTLEAVARLVEQFHGDPAILAEADARLADLAPTGRAILDRFAAVATRGPAA